MARRPVNCLQLVSVTGLSQVTANPLTASGQSRELKELGNWDFARFYLIVSAISGSGTPKVVFTLSEESPADGTYFAANPASDPIFNATGLTATNAVPLVSTVDPLYGRSYQVSWVVTGTTPSLTCSLLAYGGRRGADV